MPYYQQTHVLGVVGRDSEIRTTSGGKRVLSFSLAYTEKWKDAGGSPAERTTWFDVSKWEPHDWMLDAIKKGSHVLVIGKVSARAYEKNNEARAALDLRADSLVPLDPKKQATASAPDDSIPFAGAPWL